MFDEEFARRLDSLPDAAESARGLFQKANSVSESRVFLAVVDVERWTQDDKKFLACLPMRHWVVQQFEEYFSQVRVSIDQLPDRSMDNLFRRLQMLAYSQFWECLAIKRLTTQLIGIAEGKPYDPRILLDNRPTTANVYQSLIARSGSLNLSLSEFLIGTYSNQIRNAFAHSEFCALDEYITFFNYDSKNVNQVPSLRLATWDKLFKITSEFIIALLGTRRAYERELKSKTTYVVQLPEFSRQFALGQDQRGYWSPR